MTEKRQDPSSKLRPTGSKLRAWRAFMVAHGRLTPRLDEELRAEADLDLKSYDALLHIYEAGAAGTRMSDLADRIVLSKSGLTALVDRLETRGLVRRLPDHADRRATRITITDAGIEAFRAAADVHLAGIARNFGDRVTDAEAEVVAAVFERLVDQPG